MADSRFINGQQLALAGNKLGAPHFCFDLDTDSTNSTYTVVASAPFKFRVVAVRGHMIGAGAASDTVVVKNGSNSITDTVDVSTLSDKEVVAFNTLDDAYSDVARGGSLVVTTASAALVRLSIECVRV